MEETFAREPSAMAEGMARTRKDISPANTHRGGVKVQLSDNRCLEVSK